MTSQELFQRVRDLQLPVGKYALFGSAPMCIRGLRECADVDVIVSEDMFYSYENNPEWEVETTEAGGHGLKKGDIELFKDWLPGNWDVNKLISEAEIIDGLPFVKLEYVLEWKKKMGREKDFTDIELIEKFLNK